MILASMILVLGNGCRSGMNSGDSFWKSPTLPSFAFLKKKDDSVPKPPAVHFDPTPTNRETEIAAKNGATKNTAADLQNSLDKLGKSDSKASEKPVTPPTGPGGNQLAKSSSQPLRTPYQVSPKAAEKAMEKPTSSQVPGLSSKIGQPNASLPESFKPVATNPLNAAAKTAEQARAQFNSDMQGMTANANSALGTAGSNISNNMTGLATKAQEQISGVSGAALNQFPQAEQKLTEEQRRLEAEVAKAKQEILDLKKQLMANNQMLAPIGSTPQTGQPSSGALGTQSQAPAAQMAASQDFQAKLALRPNPGLANSAQVGSNRAEGNGNQNGFAPLRPNKNVDSTIPGSAAPQVPTQYPTTSLGGFSNGNSSTPKPDANIQRTIHQTPLVSSGSNLDSSQESGTTTADIEIPESILRGTGSFSPGSVNRLRGN
jgi:hypothetical protein